MTSVRVFPSFFRLSFSRFRPFAFSRSLCRRLNQPPFLLCVFAPLRETPFSTPLFRHRFSPPPSAAAASRRVSVTALPLSLYTTSSMNLHMRM